MADNSTNGMSGNYDSPTTSQRLQEAQARQAERDMVDQAARERDMVEQTVKERAMDDRITQAAAEEQARLRREAMEAQQGRGHTVDESV